MKKIIVQDIEKPRRSLREILPKSGRPAVILPPARSLRRKLPAAPRRRWLGLWLVAGISLVVVFMLVSKVFSGVTVTIIPKQGRLILAETIKAFAAPEAGGLGFRVIEGVTISESKVVPASGAKEVSEKAHGTIIIYNNFGSESQRLVKDTRFETTDGKIYRLPDGLVVPGRRTINGETVPGSVETTVYADKSGESYNLDLTDFTIPGFKGDPRYAKFYARSKTAMTGGFVGTIKIVAPDKELKIREALQTAIKEKVIDVIRQHLPAGQILFPNAVVISFLPGPTGTTTLPADQAEIKETGKAMAIFFDQEQLEQYLAKTQLPELKAPERVTIPNLESLAFNLSDKDRQAGSLRQATDITFTLSGNAQLVWVIDIKTIRERLAGLKKTEAESVLSQFASVVDSAKIKFRPPWISRFPANPDRIKVKLMVEAPAQ